MNVHVFTNSFTHINATNPQHTKLFHYLHAYTMCSILNRNWDYKYSTLFFLSSYSFTHLFNSLAQKKLSLSLCKKLLTSIMTAKTPTPKFDTGKNPLTFTILPEENDEGRDFVPKPPMLKEKLSNWANQILIPFYLSSKLLAFLGSYLTTKSHFGKVKKFFPIYPVTMPSVFEEHTLDLSFMDKPTRVFRFAPLTRSK